MSFISVVCAALFDLTDTPRVLLSKRPEGKSFQGLWEFPGGKVESNESFEKALSRELFEELGIWVFEEDMTPLTFMTTVQNNTNILLLLYKAFKWTGNVFPKEGQDLHFCTKDELLTYDIIPADLKMIPFILNILKDPKQ